LKCKNIKIKLNISIIKKTIRLTSMSLQSLHVTCVENNDRSDKSTWPSWKESIANVWCPMLLRLSLLLVVWLLKLLRLLVVLLRLHVVLFSYVVVLVLFIVLAIVHYLGHIRLGCPLRVTPMFMFHFSNRVRRRPLSMALFVIVSLPSWCLFGLSNISTQYKTMKKSINFSLSYFNP